MKVLVCGGRDFSDYDALAATNGPWSMIRDAIQLGASRPYTEPEKVVIIIGLIIAFVGFTVALYLTWQARRTRAKIERLEKTMKTDEANHQALMDMINRIGRK